MNKFFLVPAVLLSLSGLGVQAAPVKQTIANINADASKEGGPERVLKSISASTKVPVATLEKQKAKSGLSYGDLFIAHSIAKASGKSFEQIAALKAKGESWEKIGDDNGVSLDGKKTATKPGANASPSPTPPTRTLDQERRARMSAEHEVTNRPVRPPKK